MLIDLATHGLFTQGVDKSSIVVDLGANEGAFARAVKEQFGCEVVAVEPSRPHAAQLSNVSGIRSVHAAVSDRDGWADFHVSPNSQMSSIVPKAGETYEQLDRVELLTLSSLMAQTGLTRIDVLKVDIEGSEVGLMAGVTDDQLRNIAQVTIELHDFNGMISRAQADAIESRLLRLGFHRIQLSRTNRENVLFFQPSRCGINWAQEAWARVVTRNIIGVRRIVARRSARR